MVRLHNQLVESIKMLVDEVVFRFGVDARQAQGLLLRVFRDRELVQAVCSRILLVLSDDDGDRGGAS
jgi:hypothetical protein